MQRKLIIFVVLFVAIFTLPAADDTSLAPWWENKPIAQFVYIDLVNVDEALLETLTVPYINTPYRQSEIDALQKKLLSLNLFLEVEIIPARYEGSSDSLTLFIEFVELKPLASLKFQGNKIATSSELSQTVALNLGKPFDSSALEQSVANIKQLYRSKGYDRVDVMANYATIKGGEEIEVTFSIQEYQWYINKPIRGFTYKGLINVSEEKIADLLYPYIGKVFSQEVYREIEKVLNDLGNFSVFEGEAQRGGVNNNDLYIEFSFTELPVVRSINFSGNAGIKNKTLLDRITISPKEFISINQINSDKESLKGLYLERGYADAKIESSYVIEENTNLLDLNFTIIEERQVKVSEIAFEGNAKLSDRVLKKELTTKVQSLFNSGNYQASNISIDTQALQVTYQKNGYVDAKILEVKQEEISEEGANQKKIRLTFVIEEGEQWLFGGITVEGNTIYDDATINALLTLKEGSILDISKVQVEIGKIADLYWNEGYVENTIDLQDKRNLEEKKIAYTVYITERSQAVVEEVLVRGMTKTKPYVLERELILNAGDIFSKDKYVRSAQNLFNTGLLTDVVPSLSYGTKENSLVVTYDVTEGNQMNIGFGATFGGNVEGFPVSGFLSWSDTNLGGTGRNLEISTELSPDSQSVNVAFKDSWVKDKRWSNSVVLSFLHNSYKNGLVLGDGSSTTELRGNEAYPYPYTSYQEWIEASAPTPNSEYLMPYDAFKFSLGYTTGYTFLFKPGRLSFSLGPTLTLNRAIYDRDAFVPYDYLIEKYGDAWQFSNRLGISLSWDGRDYIQAPTSGYVISQNLIYAGGVLGGLSNYMRSSTSASAFLKIFEIPGEKPTPGVVSFNTTLSFMFNQYYSQDYNLTGDWIKGISASKYEYLYIDGMTIARGISPKFYYEFLWDSSIEFSIQIAENILWGDIFASATGVLNDLSALGSDPLNWYFSIGAGIHLKIPGFPLGLYLVKNAHIERGGEFTWEKGSIFKTSQDNSGLKLVLAITTSIY